MRILVACALLVLAAGAAVAEEIVCKGNIVSVQGEGLVNRTFRFEVSDIAGSDVAVVLEKCKKIAQERQNKAARRNPGGNFRSTSQVDLQCVKGAEKFDLRRTLRTVP